MYTQPIPLEPVVKSIAIPEIVERWCTERANSQLLLTEFCELLGLPKTDLASDDTVDNSFVFGRRIDTYHLSCSENRGYTCFYRCGCSMLEEKQLGKIRNAQGRDKTTLVVQDQVNKDRPRALEKANHDSQYRPLS